MSRFFSRTQQIIAGVVLFILLFTGNIFAQVQINPDGSFNIQLNNITLHQCLPAINDKALDGKSLKIIKQDPENIILSYTDSLAKLTLNFRIKAGEIYLKTTLQDYKNSELIKSFSPLSANKLEGSATFLRQGYSSWDASNYIDFKDLSKKTNSYGVTVLQRDDGGVLLGFNRFDRTINKFIFDKKDENITFKITSDWDNKQVKPGGLIESDEILFSPYQNLETALQTWAKTFAAKHNARIIEEPIIGWCSWYYTYSFISQKVFDEYIPAFKAYWPEMKMQYFLIDDGYQQDCGDWLIPNCKFPKGIDFTIRQIREAGYQPGIWIGPFIVGNFSQLFKDHPDWVLKDEQGKPVIKMQFFGEWHWGGRRNTEYYALDTSHPDAFAYLRKVFRTIKNDWKVDYIKTDFMYWGTTRGKRYTPGKTRLEYFMDVVRMIREEIGEDTFWSGCGMPLLPSVGYVDGMRISGDMGPHWGKDIKRIVNDLQARNFFQGIFWQNDPDCILLRDFANNYKPSQKTGLARLMGMGGGMMLTSDPLHQLTDENRDLFNFILPENGTMGCRFPFIGKNNDVVTQVREIKGQTNRYVVHLFNVTDKEHSVDYSLKELNIPQKLYACFYDENKMTTETIDRIKIDLKPFSTHLIFLQQTPVKQLPADLNF